LLLTRLQARFLLFFTLKSFNAGSASRDIGTFIVRFDTEKGNERVEKGKKTITIVSYRGTAIDRSILREQIGCNGRLEICVLVADWLMSSSSWLIFNVSCKNVFRRWSLKEIVIVVVVVVVLVEGFQKIDELENSFAQAGNWLFLSWEEVVDDEKVVEYKKVAQVWDQGEKVISSHGVEVMAEWAYADVHHGYETSVE